MSDQSQTAANAPPAEPVLCKMGCGFFGNSTTGGCCSKCWRELQKKKEPSCETVPRGDVTMESSSAEVGTAKPSPMETEETVTSTPNQESPAGTEQQQAEAPLATPAKKKKKKKQSYKSMMAGMMNSSAESRDVEKEKEALRRVTGGGAFSKVDKI